MARSVTDPTEAYDNRQTNQRLSVHQGSWYEAINSPVDGAAGPRFFTVWLVWCCRACAACRGTRRCSPQGGSCAATQRGRLWTARRDGREKVGQQCQAAWLQGLPWRPLGAILSLSPCSPPLAAPRSIYNVMALRSLHFRVFFCKYKDILKEFERGKGGRCLKVKHDLKLSLQYSFYNQHVTCLALNAVYVHN